MCKALQIALLLVLFGYCDAGATDYTYDYDAACSKAYQLYMSMHLSDANAIIHQQALQNPNNLMVTYLSDYDDFVSLLLNGDPKELEEKRPHMDERLSLLSRGDENSPWYKLCRAGIYLHWAIIDMRFGENLKAAIQFRRSYILLKENQKKFPDFQYDNFFYGLEEATCGSIPDGYRWLASILGLKGNIKHGLGLMGNFMQTHAGSDLFQPEATVFYSYMKFYLLYKQEEVWQFLNSSQFSTSNNLMYAFLKGSIARNYRKADEALQTYKEASTVNDYNKYPLFEYERGCALFLKLDPECVDHFKTFILNYKGRLFVKDAWYKISLIYYLRQSTVQANYCREQIKKQGNTTVDVDKTAQRFASSDYWPNSSLLKARLLIDGGYYKQASEILNSLNEQSFNTLSDKLEYNFRLGRVFDETGMTDKALQYYQKTITMGKNETDYYAARAALQMGFIYEKAGNPNAALKRYNECLEMHHHDFQNAIDQQAKAGVNRLTVK